MKVDQKGHTTYIKDTQGDLASFLGKVTHEYKTFCHFLNCIKKLKNHLLLLLKKWILMLFRINLPWFAHCKKHRILLKWKKLREIWDFKITVKWLIV